MKPKSSVDEIIRVGLLKEINDVLRKYSHVENSELVILREMIPVCIEGDWDSMTTDVEGCAKKMSLVELDEYWREFKGAPIPLVLENELARKHFLQKGGLTWKNE